MIVALAQINSVLGDFSGNREKILSNVGAAKEAGADLVVFPELALMGYLPNDLLERDAAVAGQLRELKRLEREVPKGIRVLLGAITRSNEAVGKPYFNSAVLLCKGKKLKIFSKQLLPTYDVFDEGRHIEKGSLSKNFFRLGQKKILVTICEDIWGWDVPGHPSNYLSNPLLAMRSERPDLVINMSASPFTKEKKKNRHSVVARTAKLFSAPVVYVNMVGGQDEIVFDGGSFVLDARGKALAQAHYFSEDLMSVNLSQGNGGKSSNRNNASGDIRQALVLGIRDFAAKTGFKQAHLGLSGGIDSAVVSCLAVEALGAANVTGVIMPGPFSSRESKSLAKELATNLGIRCLEMPISTAYEVGLETVHRALGDFEFGVVNENLQSRLRGLFLMALSNRENSLLLTTGNKAEFATGYATLYGDMCGGLAPIGDLLKREVYALADLYNAQAELIPRAIIDRPPTAELRPNQTDQDFLPPYDELDAAVVHLVEKMRPARNKIEKWLVKRIAQTEFKRWQAPPILKVSEHAFGRGRRMPIANSNRS